MHLILEEYLKLKITIKSTNTTVYQLKNADVTDAEPFSGFVRGEGLINSRLLTYQSRDLHDVVPVTPNPCLC